MVFARLLSFVELAKNAFVIEDAREERKEKSREKREDEAIKDALEMAMKEDFSFACRRIGSWAIALVIGTSNLKPDGCLVAILWLSFSAFIITLMILMPKSSEPR